MSLDLRNPLYDSRGELLEHPDFSSIEIPRYSVPTLWQANRELLSHPDQNYLAILALETEELE